jgi:hypothetical protein
MSASAASKPIAATPAAAASATEHDKHAITYYNPDDREPDKAPLQWHLIRRIFTYTRSHRAKRNWLFLLTFTRGAQLPVLAWMIGRAINGPIAGKDLAGIYRWAALYFAMTFFTMVTFHFRPAPRSGIGRSRRP